MASVALLLVLQVAPSSLVLRRVPFVKRPRHALEIGVVRAVELADDQMVALHLEREQIARVEAPEW